MKEYTTFTFDSYSFVKETGKIELSYSLNDTVHFTEALTFPLPLAEGTWDDDELDNALFALHLIGGISYFKTCVPKELVIRSGTLTPAQAAFWQSVYENGLGEFAYRNNLNLRGTIKFPSSALKEIQVSKNEEPPFVRCSGLRRGRRGTSNPPGSASADYLPDCSQAGGGAGKKRVLVPIGGGKDSVVTAELAKAAGLDVTLLRVGAHPFIASLAESLELPLLNINRQLSPALFALNAEGALNGHVPITAYLSFLAIVAAMLYDNEAVLWSSEQSASEGNIREGDLDVNHQWSKSLEFERQLQEYARSFITRSVESFSALRPLSELHIVKLFAEHPEHFEHVTSCNANWKLLQKAPHPVPLPRGEGTSIKEREGRWCGQCPKCAFAFVLFSAFMPKETLMNIFGKNLFDDESLEPLYRELLGMQGHKPFECVGTPDETKAAFLLAHARGDLDDTVIMKMVLRDVLHGIKNPQKLTEECMTPSTNHAIPKNFEFLIPNS